MAYVKVGDSEVELIEPADKSQLGGQTGLIIHHVGFFVPDLEKAMAELKANGVKLGPGPNTNVLGLRLIYIDFESTMGTRIHLTEARK